MYSTFQDYACITDSADRGRVAALEIRFVQIKAATKNVTALMHDIARQEGVPYGTLRRLYYAWRDGGAIAVADKRKLAKATPFSEVLAVYKTYCEQNKESNKGAWNAMLRDLRCGKLFGFGTWREIWAAENPGQRIPQVCPPAWVPRGWTYQNLEAKLRRDPRRLAAIAWNRQGAFAASSFVRDVIRTRYDVASHRQLPGGSVFQWDDAWENVMCTVRGMKGLFRPLGFHCYDIATGYHFQPWMKPRTFSKMEGTDRVKGDNLTEQMFRMAFAYHHLVNGINKSGVLHVLEKGTTAIREPVRQRIAKIPRFGALIRFSNSGAVNAPVLKGMFLGKVGGNPRFKSTVEGGHRISQLAMAFLPANMGHDADHLPESYGNMRKQAEETIAEVNEANLPVDIFPLLKLRFPTFEQYMQVYGAVSDTVNDATDHRLEGWVDYHVEEFRDPDDPNLWHPMSMLETLTPVTQERIQAMIAEDPSDMVRSRRMSRREAWYKWVRSGEVVKVPMSELQYFMDERDAKILTVTPKRTVEFTDSYFYGPGVRMVYSGQCLDSNGIPHMLSPGQKVRVYFNPCGELAGHIWVANMDDEPIGMCDLVEKAYWADDGAVKRLAGQKLQDTAYLLSDTRVRHLDEAAQQIADAAANRILVEVAKEQVAEPPRRVRAKSADVLGIASEAPAAEAEEEEVESVFNPLSIR